MADDAGALSALNFYSDRQDAYGEHAKIVGRVLATHAAMAMSASQEHAQTAEGATAVTTGHRTDIYN